MTKVTGAPEAIWLVYGDLEHDDTHANCYRDGDVDWCDESQYPADVRYVRADIAEAEIARLNTLERQLVAAKIVIAGLNRRALDNGTERAALLAQAADVEGERAANAAMTAEIERLREYNDAISNT